MDITDIDISMNSNCLQIVNKIRNNWEITHNVKKSLIDFKNEHGAYETYQVVLKLGNRKITTVTLVVIKNSAWIMNHNHIAYEIFDKLVWGSCYIMFEENDEEYEIICNAIKEHLISKKFFMKGLK